MKLTGWSVFFDFVYFCSLLIAFRLKPVEAVEREIKVSTILLLVVNNRIFSSLIDLLNPHLKKCLPQNIQIFLCWYFKEDIQLRLHILRMYLKKFGMSEDFACYVYDFNIPY